MTQKNMTLGEKQELFARLHPRLIDKAWEIADRDKRTVRLGDLFRDERVHGPFGIKKGYGHSKSCHKLKLAQDINFIKNRQLMAYTEDHQELGEWWEKQHPLCCWGGRFKRPDGNHYSITHWGAK